MADDFLTAQRDGELPRADFDRAPGAAGGPLVPRVACPVGVMPSCRADRLSSSHVVSTPSSISARAWVGVPSPSKLRDRSPRTRRGSS